MKIYTRKGDSGQTGIWGGRRLGKDHVRMEAIGAVDECNAAIGSALATGLPGTLSSILVTAQGRLFIVGSELMAPEHAGSGSGLPRLAEGGDRARDGHRLARAGPAGAAELHSSRRYSRRGRTAPGPGRVPARGTASGRLEPGRRRRPRRARISQPASRHAVRRRPVRQPRGRPRRQRMERSSQPVGTMTRQGRRFSRTGDDRTGPGGRCVNLALWERDPVMAAPGMLITA